MTEREEPAPRGGYHDPDFTYKVTAFSNYHGHTTLGGIGFELVSDSRAQGPFLYSTQNLLTVERKQHKVFITPYECMLSVLKVEASFISHMEFS